MTTTQDLTRGHHLIRRHFGIDRTLGDRAADRFVAVFGSWAYIIWQTVAVILWLAGNAVFLPMVLRRPPDPYPFILLNLVFSTQASYAAPLVLMAQNRAAARDKDFALHQFELLESNTKMTEAMLGLTQAIHDHITGSGQG